MASHPGQTPKTSRPPCSILPEDVPGRSALVLKDRLRKLIPPAGDPFASSHQNGFAGISFYKVGGGFRVKRSFLGILIFQPIIEFAGSAKQVNVASPQIPANRTD
jgi:hypothetical protein